MRAAGELPLGLGVCVCACACGCRCPDSGGQYLMGGPIWSEPIHDQQFVAGLLKSLDQDKAR